MVIEEEWEFLLYDWNEFKHLANAGERSYALSWIRVSTNSTVLKIKISVGFLPPDSL